MTINKAGFVGLIGRPNVGKSTLLNQLLGQKISITSPKPQTTRLQILGIKSVADAQIIYIDTPGLHQQEKKAVNRYMNRAARAVIFDADLIVFMIDADYWHREDELVLDELKKTKKPIILALNKIDLIQDKSKLLPMIGELKLKYPFAQIVPLSALDNINIETLEQEISKLLPPGPALYPEEQRTDKDLNFQIAEIIREKIIQLTEQELPYATAVAIEDYKQDEKLTEICAVIWVERPGQKMIMIGKQGAMLKKIGTAARYEIEKLIGSKVFLRLWVKVKSRWADNEKALRNLGYE